MTIRIQSARAACIALFLAAASPISALAQPAKVPPPIDPKSLVVDPAAAPVPALKYRLLPGSADLNSGDAAPVYLRIRYQTEDGPWNEIGRNYLKWRNVPLDRFPTAEARKFVDQFSRQLEQIEFGARRQTCAWNYTLPEQRLDQINIALSDVQGMRQWLRLLDLKVGVEIAEGKYEQALQTIETGLAFSRHIAEGSFLINGLVGIAGAHLMLARCEELIAQPGSPNLYWALTALPRPLFDLRHAVENERKLCENMIPELIEAASDRQRTAAEWSALLARMHARMVNWSRVYADAEDPLKSLATWNLARLKAESLPAAREYLKASRGLNDRQLAEMGDDQAVALYLTGRYRELWDEHFKASYLPMRDAIPQLAAAAERVHTVKSVPLAFFTGMTPSLQSAMTSNLRPDRHIAALRTIEALRLHAAAHGGELPESLDQVAEVPIPKDPATDEPFIYRAADAAAILHGVRGELPPPWISYRITIRR
jgi:hypothetical protein